LWLRPGVHPDEEAMVALVEKSLPKDRHAAVFELFEKMGAGHPDELHWYLPMIAVDTHQQNRGIGSSLMRHSLERCDAENVPAYLESSNPRNIPLYLRFGFEPIGEISAGGSPPLVPMLRRRSRQSFINH
jgi:ribosomal protein S18 acetylase RimI-like enzyme